MAKSQDYHTIDRAVEWRAWSKTAPYTLVTVEVNSYTHQQPYTLIESALGDEVVNLVYFRFRVLTTTSL